MIRSEIWRERAKRQSGSGRCARYSAGPSDGQRDRVEVVWKDGRTAGGPEVKCGSLDTTQLMLGYDLASSSTSGVARDELSSNVSAVWRGVGDGLVLARFAICQ